MHFGKSKMNLLELAKKEDLSFQPNQLREV